MTLLIAHRGDPLMLRENTLPSVLSAMTEGADWVEVDVKLTRDGVAVLLHDDTLTRLWGHELPVASLSFAELEALTRDDRWRIPTLREALELACGTGVPLMVDVPRPAEALAAAELVGSLGCFATAVFTGPPVALALVREAAPQACIAMSWESPMPPRPALLHRVRPDYVNPHHRWLTSGRIARLQRRGLKVSTWTVDSPRRMAALAAAGIDAIISNDLRSLRHVLALHSPGRPKK
ncbi:glycerophosphodiester phosphodiesterase [Streptacidiphilus cavernicola]|uniref:Glycerophosphodiester phosphodiesterase n=1 Tax=Streptacidiphilus cavernicola TaxID=3342716 RepID=A0ABV6VXH8_9ACTN